jgi:hypothetical protein
MTARQKRINTIKALLSKTVENGCTEGEAMAALAMARRMMDADGIDDLDLNFGGETVTDKMKVKTDYDKIRDHLATPVGFFCGCQAWKRGTSDAIVFCGLESEALFAHWLLDMLDDFVLRELDGYRHRNLRSRRVTRLERSSFILGCTGRIAERLRELTPEPAAGNGRDLVVAKNAMIMNYMAERGIKPREPFKLYRTDDQAYGAGVSAGDQAQFNRPVDGRQERKLLS